MKNRWFILFSLVACLGISQAIGQPSFLSAHRTPDPDQKLVNLTRSVYTDEDCDPINDPGGCRRS
ncbi:MAG TPA: hypothetical protein IGR64_11740 [Leptolyngbyaceae cyanobacterium M65_K2018_010]|nr:hypothetical protein [Leptolyngbyaceae cyanobacterium M65_K2018_010]